MKSHIYDKSKSFSSLSAVIANLSACLETRGHYRKLSTMRLDIFIVFISYRLSPNSFKYNM